MRRVATLLAIALAACDLPSGSLPATITPFGAAAQPAPETTLGIRFLVLGVDGTPSPTPLTLVLDTAARRLGLGLAADADGPLSDSIAILSGANGTALAFVGFGRLAGRAVVHIRALNLAIRDSIVYELRNLVAVIDVPPITPLYPGDSLVLQWAAYDSLGHKAFASPAFAVDAPAIATVSGNTLYAHATGTTTVRVTSGAVTDSSILVVIPQGRFGAVSNGAWTLADMNGTARTAAFTAPPGFATPRASTSGDTLLYGDGVHILVRVPSGATISLVPTALGFSFDRHPAWSADGQWVYFTAGYADGRAEIWRIRPDGTGATRAGPAAATGERDSMPAVNTDGSRLAFTTNRVLAGGVATIQVFDTGTGTVVFGAGAGANARYSPDGTRLAFSNGGQLMCVDTDGANLRVLVPAMTQFSGPLAWSPDSRWILIVHSTPLGNYLHLVDTSTDTAIRLLYSFLWTLPEWID